MGKEMKLKYQKLIGMPPSPLSKTGGEQGKYWTLSDGEMVNGRKDDRIEELKEERKIEIQTDIVQNQLEPACDEDIKQVINNESPP